MSISHDTPSANHAVIINDEEALGNQPVVISNLVAFSKDRPPMPSSSASKKRTWQPEEAVCDTEMQWIQKETATDIFGRTVLVADSIQTAGGDYVSQWFYETKCSTAGQSSCRGVDTKMWFSECVARDSFVYAVVVINGETGWFWIRMSTACNCALKRKSSGSQSFKRGVPYPFVDITETAR